MFENLLAPSYENQLAMALVENLMKPTCVISSEPSSKCPMEIYQLYVFDSPSPSGIRTFFYFPVFSFSELSRIPQEPLGFPRCLQSFSGALEKSWVLLPCLSKLPGELPGAPLKDSWKPRISQSSQKPLGSLAPPSLGELSENLQ